ncbi:MAG: hypothetical protein SGI72_13665 [Planctomycetota bacterium]|nr:hypothetical protein [Planctomycetota bacterium]
MKLLIAAAGCAALGITRYLLGRDERHAPVTVPTPDVPLPADQPPPQFAGESTDRAFAPVISETATSKDETTVHGRVVSLTGELVKRGEVVASPFRLEPANGASASTEVTTTVSAEGTFDIELTHPAELTYSDGEHEQTLVSALVHELTPAVVEREIVVAASTKITGVVVLENGAGLPGVFVRQRFPAEWIVQVAGPKPRNRSWRLTRWVETKHDGSFALPVVLVPGSVLEVVDEERVLTTASILSVQKPDVRLVCVRERISGYVVDESGAPTRGTHLVVASSAGEIARLPMRLDTTRLNRVVWR